MFKGQEEQEKTLKNTAGHILCEWSGPSAEVLLSLGTAISLCCFTRVKCSIPKRHKYIRYHGKGCSPDLSMCEFHIPALYRLVLELIKNLLS